MSVDTGNGTCINPRSIENQEDCELTIKITLETGDVYFGDTYASLVRQMSRHYPRGETTREYMDATARRVEIWDAVKIRTKTPEQFIRELQRVGVVTEILEF